MPGPQRDLGYPGWRDVRLEQGGRLPAAEVGAGREENRDPDTLRKATKHVDTCSGQHPPDQGGGPQGAAVPRPVRRRSAQWQGSHQSAAQGGPNFLI